MLPSLWQTRQQLTPIHDPVRDTALWKILVSAQYAQADDFWPLGNRAGCGPPSGREIYSSITRDAQNYLEVPVTLEHRSNSQWIPQTRVHRCQCDCKTTFKAINLTDGTQVTRQGKLKGRSGSPQVVDVPSRVCASYSNLSCWEFAHSSESFPLLLTC